MIKYYFCSDPGVRDASAEALGTLLKLVGEKAIMPFLVDIEAIKMTKIKECSEKAVILVKAAPAASKKEARPSTAPVKSDTKAVVTKRPTTASKTTTKKPASKVSKVKAPVERELSEDDVDEKVCDYLPQEVVSGLCDSIWKTRLSAMERFNEIIMGLETDQTEMTQVLVKILNRKPGLKDTNVQVLKMRLTAIKVLAENFPFSM